MDSFLTLLIFLDHLIVANLAPIPTSGRRLRQRDVELHLSGAVQVSPDRNGAGYTSSSHGECGCLCSGD